MEPINNRTARQILLEKEQTAPENDLAERLKAFKAQKEAQLHSTSSSSAREDAKAILQTAPLKQDKMQEERNFQKPAPSIFDAIKEREEQEQSTAPEKSENIETLTQDKVQKEVDLLAQEEIEEDTEVIEEKKPKKSLRFRFKLIFAVYTVVFVTLFGWVIGNAISIHNQANALADAQSEYEMNLASYITKINGLNSPPEQNDPSMELIDSIIPLTPIPLEEDSYYDKGNNFFNIICDWLSHLFGG